MGVRPSKEYSVDRVDVNGNYTPDNCRWATNTEQASNRRDNIEHVGVYEMQKSDRVRYKAVAQMYNKFIINKYFDTLEEAILARKEAIEKHQRKL
jgi:hypothetical protein